MLNESLGKLHFWLFLIGFHMTFDVMHIPASLVSAPDLHLRARPRMEYFELDSSPLDIYQGIATSVFAANLIFSYFQGTRAANDPGSLDARVVGEFAPPGVTLRIHSDVASRRPL